MATPLGIELLLIATGPLRLLNPKAKPIRRQEMDGAADFEKSVSRNLRAFLELEKHSTQEEEPEERDYFDTLELVSQDVPLERRMAVCSELPDPMVAGEYSVRFDQLHRFLRDTIPRRSYVTLTGPKSSEPSGCELSAYWRAWEVVEDPRVVLRDMREGILVSDQVTAVKQLYPMVYAVLTMETIRALAEAKSKSKDPDWEPAGWQEQQIETLLQISRLSPDLAAELQARARMNEQTERAKEQGDGFAATRTLSDKPADSLQTPVQRIAGR